jgi:signal transduction histidine kinase/ligand-binding sensor domain-containing protein
VPVAAAPIPVVDGRAVDHWQDEQGLPSAVSALLATADGYLWVGTRRGLFRFDGLRFARVAVSDGTAELNVRALLEDPDGAVWVGSDAGLGRFFHGRFTPLPAQEGPVQALRRDRHGTRWAASDRGLARLEGDRLVRVEGADGPLSCLAEDAEGRLLAGAATQLLVLRDGRLEPLPLAEGGAARRIQALLTDRRGRTWIGTNEGLFRGDREGAWARRPFGAGLASSSVTAMVEDGEGRIWVATVAGGLQRLSPDGATAGPREARMPARPVTALVTDGDGSLWSGSGAGLDRLRPRILLSVTERDGLTSEVVWSVYADPADGALWFGLDGAGADRLANGKLTAYGARWGLQDVTVASTLRTRQGALWLSFRSEGVMRTRGDRLEPVLDAAGRPYVRVRGLFQTRDGSIWLGTETGLERHLEGKAARVAVSGGWPFRVLAQDQRGDLWAGGARLVRLVGTTFEERTPPELAPVRDVVALAPDGGDLWIASYSTGLLLWHAGRLTSFAELDRRFAGRAVAALPDDQDGLWVALEGSLVLARRSDLLAVAEGRPRPLRVLTFDERDGLPSTEFTTSGQSSAARAADGRLWFGTVAGLVVVEPERLRLLEAPAPPLVERVFLGGSELPLDGGPLRLEHGDATLELHFTSPTLVSPHRLQFRHRLLGHEEAWQASGPQRTATYRGLPEGNLVFEVEASRDGVEWVATREPIQLLVRPGPLERTWVRALLVLAAVALLLGAAAALQALRGRQLRARAEELRRLVEARTAELAAARDQLEARVEERTAQLQRELAERERLERTLVDAQKLDSIGRLAGGVAHDLNNLLTVVLGCASTAQLPDATAAEVREDLGEIQKAGERAAALTRQLLAFARRQVLTSKRLDLNEVVRGVGTLLRRLLGANLTLVTATDQQPCPVLADPGQLEQVLVNLAVNARDAMHGGGTLRLETAPVRLARDAGGAHPGVAAGDYVRLTVRDTGTGLSPEAERHLFEPFFTTKEKGQGTGLGLATCYGIVRQMGGHIWLHSEAGRGTTVEIHLPRAEGALAPAAATPAGVEAAAPGGSERLLVVEDEPQVRAMAARALSERGYQVLTAGDGEEALQVLAGTEVPIALLLTDVIMPRMGGVELAARMARQRPGLPVLFMSGYVDSTVGAQGGLPEGAALLHKPFTPSALAARVREALDAPGSRP